MCQVLPSSPFDGVWKRESIALDGGASFEDSNVYWLHAGGHFADMRWPKGSDSLGGVSAFAGSAHWEPPSMRFEHELDLNEGAVQDIGTMVFADNKLIESGETSLEGMPIKFEEVWVRASEPKEGYCVARHATGKTAGFIVRVGDFLIVLEKQDGVLNAGAWRREEDWVSLFSIRQSAALEITREKFVSGMLAPHWNVIKRV